MAEFVIAILQFPTVMFTALLALVLTYWLTMIVGVLDLDFLDGALGLDAMEGAAEGIDGALDGAAESIDGALEGVADAADGALEGAAEAADGALEGAADAADGALEGAAEGADAAEAHTGGAIAGFLTALGIRGVPLTIYLSFVTVGAWLLSYLVTSGTPVGSLGGMASAVAGAGTALAALLASMFVSSYAVRPLKPMFVIKKAPVRASLVGKTCTVTSGRVSATSGQAEIADGGSGFIAEVRCAEDNQLARGSKALVFNYDPEQEVFRIAPLDRALEESHGS